MEHLHDNTEISKSGLTGQDVQGKKKTYYTTSTILFGM